MPKQQPMSLLHLTPLAAWTAQIDDQKLVRSIIMEVGELMEADAVTQEAAFILNRAISFLLRSSDL